MPIASTRARILRARLEMEADLSDLKQFRAEMDKITDTMKRMEETSQRLRRIRERFREINIVAGRIAIAGGAIVASMTALAARFGSFADKYVNSAGAAEDAASRWRAAQERLEDANVRLGRAAATALLPTLERMTALAERAAAFVEQHPEFLRAAVNIGTVLAVTGGLTRVIGESVRVATTLGRAAHDVMAAIKLAGMASQVKGEAAAQAAAALAGKNIPGALSSGGVSVLGASISTGLLAGLTALTVAIGALTIAMIARRRGETPGETLKGAGIAGLNLLKILAVGVVEAATTITKALIKFGARLQELVAQVQRMIYQLSGGRVGLSQKSYERRMAIIGGNRDQLLSEVQAERERIVQSIASMFTGGGGAGAPTGGAIPQGWSRDTLDAFEKFTEETQKLEFDYQQQRIQTIQHFNQETLQLEADYQRQRQQTIEDFERQQARQRGQFLQRLAQQDADNRDRVQGMRDDAARDDAQREDDFEQERAKRQRDYYRQRERSLEEHLQRLKEAAGRLDAVAVLNEMQRFNQQQRRSDEDFRLQEKDRAQAFARERAQRQADLEQRISDQEEAYEKQRKRQVEEFEQQEAIARMDFQRRLDRMDEEHQRTMDRRQQQFNQELSQMDAQHRTRMAIRDYEFAQQLQQQQYFDQATEDELSRHYAALSSMLDQFIAGAPSQAQIQAQQTLESYGGYYTTGGNLRLPAGTGETITQQQRADILQALATSQGFQHGGAIPRDMMARLHRGEQVITERTASALRRLMGGGINESALLAAVSAGRNNLNSTNNFYGTSAEQIGHVVDMRLRALLEGI